jgi:hypothetical protein
VADRLRAMAADEVAAEFGIVLGAEAERGNNEGSVS